MRPPASCVFRPHTSAAASIHVGARLFLLFLLLSSLHMLVPPWVSAQESITIPLADRLPDGRLFGYWLPIRVGAGDPSLVLLDTGSKGLMLRADHLDKQVTQRTGKKYRQTFLDGTVFDGEIVKVPVQIGPVPTREPISVLAISRIECSKDKPDCPARIFANKSFAGVMGVGLGDVTALDNPLEHLPKDQTNGFIIHGGTIAPPSLTVGLTATNHEGFTIYHMPSFSLTFSWREAFMKSNAIPACFSVGDSGINCGRILFDTGSSQNILHTRKSDTTSTAFSAGILSPGQTVTVTPKGMGELVLPSDGIAWSRHFIVSQDSDGVSTLGAGAFKFLDVLYDFDTNSIGLKLAK